MEDDRGPAHRPQLPERVSAVARLADGLATKVRHLVRPDDQRVGMKMGNRSRLRFGKPHGRLRRPLGRQRRLIDIRRYDVEGEPQALQQRTAIARTGGENQRWDSPRSHCFHGFL